MTILLFFIILGALIFVHELGHFISAKRAGIRVDEFALGFPPRLFSVKRGETRYALNLVPFGGYVKIHGEDREESREESEVGRRFIDKSRWVQALVLFSGVLGNLIFAWLLISVTFLSGIPSSIEGRYANEVKDVALTITSVLPDSPAAKAGLKTADEVLSLRAGERRFEGQNAEAARVFIGEAETELLLSYRRAGATHFISLEPIPGIIVGKKAIGVTLDTVGVVRFGFFRALGEGLLTTFDLSREVAGGLFGFIKEVFLGQADFGAIAGPVGIAGLVGEARTLGLIYLLSFTAFISINLAVINLLPIPALDGGRLLFLSIEAVLRRPIPPKIAKTLNSIGFALLLLFMAVITYRDLIKLL